MVLKSYNYFAIKAGQQKKREGGGGGKKIRYAYLTAYNTRIPFNGKNYNRKHLTKTYCHMNTGSRIALDRTNVCFHVNAENTGFLLCAPHFDLSKRNELRDSKLQNQVQDSSEPTAGGVTSLT